VSWSKNVAAVRRFNEAMEAADRDALSEVVDELTHPEAEWAPLVTAVEGQVYRGRDGARTFFRDFHEAFTVHYADPEFRRVGSDDVLMLCCMELRGRGSGVDVSQEIGVIFEFEEGLVRRGRVFPSHAEALAAAEVSV
jgi:hypothetical protein